MLQNATPLRKSASWPPNISDEHVFCTAPATENASLQILFKCPMPAILFGDATKPSRFAHFWQGAQSLAPATRNEIWMSKSGPNVVCFVHFDFEMCFAPQRRALFRHLNFQKCSEHGVFCTFWLRKCASRDSGVHFFNISTSKSAPNPWCVLYILTSKCASRHNGVHFFDISTSKSGPKLVFCAFWLGNVLRATTACNFSSLIWPDGSAPAALASLLFDPPAPHIIGKTQVFRDFPTFWLFSWIFFLLTPSLRWSSLLLFCSLLFSDSSNTWIPTSRMAELNPLTVTERWLEL